MKRLALALLLASGCSVDAYGVRGTKFMLAEMQHARENGSLACAVAFSRRTRFGSFDNACTYEPEARVCRCRVQSADRFADKILEPIIEIKFPVDPCVESLPEGLEFPLRPSFVAAVKGIREAAAELGMTLPKELDAVR